MASPLLLASDAGRLVTGSIHSRRRRRAMPQAAALRDHVEAI